MLHGCCLRRSFFVKGRQFRQPAYLATSFSEAVARQFLAMRGGSDCVLWRVRSIPSSFCFCSFGVCFGSGSQGLPSSPGAGVSGLSGVA